MSNGVWNRFVVQSAIVTTHTGKPKIVMAFLLKEKKNVWDSWAQKYDTKYTDSQGKLLTSTATTSTLPPPSLRRLLTTTHTANTNNNNNYYYEQQQ